MMSLLLRQWILLYAFLLDFYSCFGICLLDAEESEVEGQGCFLAIAHRIQSTIKTTEEVSTEATSYVMHDVWCNTE